jgi:hypothetical protein
MKKLLAYTILAVSIILYSCDNGRITDLENSVSELTEINSKLIDSIQTLKEKNITSFYLIENLEKDVLKINETGKVHVDFGYKNHIGYISEYDVYRLYGKNYEERELILKNQKISEFDFEFKPKNINDNRIKLEVIMKFNGYEYIIPADFQINVVD